MEGSAKVIFVLGGPGVGKGTQCQKLVQEHSNFVHLSAGELLRGARAGNHRFKEVIESNINAGRIVPSEITVELLREAMINQGWAAKRFLIDGFPRNEENYETWNRILPEVEVECCLFLDCNHDLMVERIRSRGGGRSDDDPEIVKKRLVTYEEQTRPIINRYQSLGKLRTVSSEGTLEEVYQNVLSALEIS
ncbi:unnamed protein product [Blepharisma stoltei]|uniref:UMP/CMP kinase n=1 Tax=Blepharisma stoltei TaxID=1481888 RepID=A0AAU9JSN4_9CILI|nr:unnamed protein product [Blepharisma stoltei]